MSHCTVHLLLSTLLQTAFVIGQQISPLNGQFRAVQGHDTRSSRTQIQTVEERSRFHCGNACLRQVYCGGFNYRKITAAHASCDLLAGPSDGNDVTSASGSTYYELVGEYPQLPGDCADYLPLGVDPVGVTPIDITVNGAKQRIDVFCESGGWTVLLNRCDGSVDFIRPWNDYKAGIGTLAGEFYLGNDYIHAITNQKTYTMRVDVTRFNGQSESANYDRFRIESEADLYRLDLGSFTGGNAGDSLGPHNGMAFSTFDNDNDLADYNCAHAHSGGSWWHGCSTMRLTTLWGEDYPALVITTVVSPTETLQETYSQGIWWTSWLGIENPEKVSLKIKP